VFSSLFNWLMGAGRELAVVLISMVPLVELRGAVPLGAVAGVPAIELIPLAVIGNMIPIPFLLFFGEKLLDWVCSLGPLSGFATKYREKLLGKTGQVTRYVPFCGDPAAGHRSMVGCIDCNAAQNAENQGADFDSVRRNCCRLYYAARFSGCNWRCTFVLKDNSHSHGNGCYLLQQ
jgi:hypothetical protein